jgi:serine/threonine-protein phosphatase 2B catalytic subunit
MALVEDLSAAESPIRRVDDRRISTVPTPEWYPLSTAQLFGAHFDLDAYWRAESVEQQVRAVPDLKVLREHFSREGRLLPEHVAIILHEAELVLRKDETLLQLQAPVTIFGDIHGQYFDLVNIFNTLDTFNTLSETETRYLFLGDYVDRGGFGLEVVLLLLCMKLHYPHKIYLLRGNHECRLLAKHFNFYKECMAKLGKQWTDINAALVESLQQLRAKHFSEPCVSISDVSQFLFEHVMRVFDWLALAALVINQGQKFFAVHGGLSPHVPLVTDVLQLKRGEEPSKIGAICDLMWSDPLEDNTAQGLSEADHREWLEVEFVENPYRGCGQVYGYAAINRFLCDNELTMIVRAHEVSQTGYEYHWLEQKSQRADPLVVTLFSAPNYLDLFKNQGAVMHVLEQGYQFQQFKHVPHPFTLPSSVNAIAYTLPDLTEKVVEVIVTILNLITPSEEEVLEEQDVKRARALNLFRSKVLQVTQLKRAVQTIREARNQELALSVQGDMGFEKAKEIDAKNEMIPGSLLPTPQVEKDSIQFNSALSFWKKIQK